MARTKAFDRTEVLERAMTLFWRQGYEATSIQDLVAHTGVNRASLYATYGDKRTLFGAALAHYRDVVSARRMRQLTEPGAGKAAIRRFFRELIEYSLGEGHPLGCLLANSAIELAPHDPALVAECTAGIAR
ncbi:MAG: helix-turn-helix domain-containing protein, partial [Candidatus Competibacterales bacterium]|nr:helix-turn-helix domain-containing protein [Candidatus Competibacterales bacterium]